MGQLRGQGGGRRQTDRQTEREKERKTSRQKASNGQRFPCPAQLVCVEFFLRVHGGKQGSGPDRGRSPIEWEDFPSTHLSVHLSWLPGWALGLAGWAKGGCTDGRTNVRTYRKSPHSTGLCPLSGPLPKNSNYDKLYK